MIALYSKNSAIMLHSCDTTCILPLRTYLGPLDVSVSEYGREIKDGIICPSIDEANCSCHRVKLSCTIYCFCSTAIVCRNSFIKKEDDTGDEEQTQQSFAPLRLTLLETNSNLYFSVANTHCSMQRVGIKS